jgi:imidazolonepropionase-like amidohydrolase
LTVSPGRPRPLQPLLVRGSQVLDVATGECSRRDFGVREGVICLPEEAVEPVEVNAGGLTVLFGMWDCHAHPGSLMYDPAAEGYFETAAQRTVRASANLGEAVRMGVTGVRCVGEAGGIDLALSTAFRRGELPGPRLTCAGPGIRTTGGHGTAFPRRPVELQWDLVADGPTEMRRAVRSLVEQGVDWVKVMLTGGLFSEHETVEDAQLADDELEALMGTALLRGLPVAAHCGSARVAERFAEAGGRSIEHGYALDEGAAAAMARAGTWLVPTIGVTHDDQLMAEDGWPEHARNRARQAAPRHAESLRLCAGAGVRLAAGADLNPIGPRLRAELFFLERAGLSRLQVLRAATAGGRALNGLGEASAPGRGCAADLIFVEGDPLEDLEVCFEPRAVMVFGRFVKAFQES